MNIRARLAKLEKCLGTSEDMTEEEFDRELAEVVARCQDAVFYVLTHPNGCFSPPVPIGRTKEDITIAEIVDFQNAPFASIDDLDREVCRFLLDEDQPINEQFLWSLVT